MQEFREQTLSRDIAGVMRSDRANRNGVQGKSGNARYNLVPRVFSNRIPMAAIPSQKGLIVLVGFMLFLGCLWTFYRPN